MREVMLTTEDNPYNPLNDDEFDDFIDKKLTDYEPFWKKCIILEVNN